ncbi:hypothetical protein Halru_0425 [Halovivax ruber XH-70]|uniref:eCIS core domain-containing protein n=1 Tax=Halovivax ruber (strain DSM 18193 / JCM 13892 / XH-70) TaxID=797302 RepID=L0IAT0_HALRX|nr:hypothetical protein Halru_0425 [Halovivax ruber XH-70]
MANPVRAGHTTYPEFADGGAPLGSPGCPVESPIPRSKHRPFVSRGYDREDQRNIMRAIDGTGTRTDEVPDTVYDVLATGGRALDTSIQRALEDRMDADFSDVRIHTGPKAAKAADAINARAFTCGNAIVFNDGEYDPESPEGQYLLAHELAHVRQQTGAAISMMPQPDADLEIDPDPQLEREADQAAEEALSGEEPLIVNRLGTDVHIQRSAKGESEYVTRDEVLEIVDNYYRGAIEQEANQDPLAAGPERTTAQGSVSQPAKEESGGFLATVQNAWTQTKTAASNLSQVATKGAVGSLAAAGGKLLGGLGGRSLGGWLGGAIGSLGGPMGTVAGVAVGQTIGTTVGAEVVGGAVGDVAKEVTGYALSQEHAAAIESLQEKYRELEEEVNELRNSASVTGSGASQGVGTSRR